MSQVTLNQYVSSFEAMYHRQYANNIKEVLSEKFSWDEFLRDLSTHLNVAYGPIVDPYMRRHALTAPASPIRGPTQFSTQDQFGMQIGTAQEITSGKAVQSNPTTRESKLSSDQPQQNEGSFDPSPTPVLTY